MLFSDLATNEEFLASHVLRIPGGVSAKDGQTNGGANGATTFREQRAKAKQYNTLNGRTVIVKDSYVYTNKGMCVVVFGVVEKL